MEQNQTKDEHSVHIGILVLAVAVASYFAYAAGQGALKTNSEPQKEEKIEESASFTISATWGDLGIKMASVGVIDPEKFEALYAKRGELTDAEKQTLYGKDNKNLKINKKNAGFWLNVLWPLGLGNKNDVLESGPMSQYGDMGRFASTGGWILAKGNAMDHYSRHRFIVLTEEQQKLVERVSKNVYRPCCRNSTYFPDCNHGMAMLGLLELMASQGVPEEEMYKVAEKVNSYWFPKSSSGGCAVDSPTSQPSCGVE